MPRVDRASRLVAADAARVFAALIDPAALERWLPPSGMSGRFEHFDARQGGSYRLVLSYDDAENAPGKTTSDSDVSELRFVTIEPNERLVQTVEFVSDDPAFSGTMTMTWVLRQQGDATTVEVSAEDVPAGISAEDHVAGLTSSLVNLAEYLDALRGD